MGGGTNNEANQEQCAIGGGIDNRASGKHSTIGGGSGNQATKPDSTVGGGSDNDASGISGSVGGGASNTASGRASTVPGGLGNAAGGFSSFAAGRGAKIRDLIQAGDDPLTCDFIGTCGDEGTFVWADTTPVPFQSTGPNQFLIRAAGGVGIGTNSPAGQLDVAGVIRSSGPMGGLVMALNPNNQGADMHISWLNNVARIRVGGTGTGAQNGLDIQKQGDVSLMRLLHNGHVGIGTRTPSHPLQVGIDSTNGNGAHVTIGGVWTNGSDRNSKTRFTPVNSRESLAKVARLPVTQWQYKGEPESVRHIGPVAQDFHAAFGLGDSEKHIGTLDADGVALAAIQGLHEIVKEQDAQITALRARVTALEQSIGKMSSRASTNSFGMTAPAIVVLCLVGLLAWVRDRGCAPTRRAG